MFSSDYLINIFFSLILAYLLYRIFDRCLSIRPRSWARAFFFLVLFIITSPIVLPGELTGSLGILALLSAAVFLFFTDRPVVKAAVILIIYPMWVSFSYLSYNIGYVIWMYCFRQNMSEMGEMLLMLCCALLRIPFLMLVERLAGKWLASGEVSFSSRIWAVITSTCLASFLGIITLIYQVDPTRTFVIWPACIACILTAIGICHVCDLISRSVRKAMEGDMLRTRQTYYEDLRREQELVRGMRHDMMNHLGVIRSLLEQGETLKVRSYLKGLTRGFSSPLKVFCENDMINALLNVKYQLAVEKGIECRFMMEFPQEAGMDMVRLCSLLANTLDNAIEGSERMTEEQERSITLKGRCDGGYFSYHIENRVAAGTMMRGKGRFVTSKKDRRLHGQGLRIIGDLVAEMNGTVDISLSEDIFSVTALIPTGEKETAAGSGAEDAGR